MKDIIKTYNLSKRYGENYALKDVNLTVRQGEIYGLVGNNGAGKTTLLRLLTGQTKHYTGEFKLFDKSSDKELENVRKNTGTIIEAPSFYPNLTVKENLEYYRIQRGIPNKNKVLEYLRLVNLYNSRNKKFSSLSLGMKQRLGLALAMMNEPELLILDEPINGLDPSGIMEIRNLLLKFNKEKNVTIIISSHILGELSNIATWYGFLSNGILVEEISKEKLEEKCTSYLSVKVNNFKKMTALLELELGYKNYKVMPDGSIDIYDRNRNPEDVSNVAVKNGLGLTSIQEKSIELENYYMSLIGGVCNA